MPQSLSMRKSKRSAASEIGAALAALRMKKMTPERRREVARQAGIASGAARRKAREAQSVEDAEATA